MKTKLKKQIKYIFNYKTNMKLVIVESPAKCKKIRLFGSRI